MRAINEEQGPRGMPNRKNVFEKYLHSIQLRVFVSYISVHCILRRRRTEWRYLLADTKPLTALIFLMSSGSDDTVDNALVFGTLAFSQNDSPPLEYIILLKNSPNFGSCEFGRKFNLHKFPLNVIPLDLFSGGPR